MHIHNLTIHTYVCFRASFIDRRDISQAARDKVWRRSFDRIHPLCMYGKNLLYKFPINIICKYVCTVCMVDSRAFRAQGGGRIRVSELRDARRQGIHTYIHTYIYSYIHITRNLIPTIYIYIYIQDFKRHSIYHGG